MDFFPFHSTQRTGFFQFVNIFLHSLFKYCCFDVNLPSLFVQIGFVYWAVCPQILSSSSNSCLNVHHLSPAKQINAYCSGQSESATPAAADHVNAGGHVVWQEHFQCCKFNKICLVNKKRLYSVRSLFSSIENVMSRWKRSMSKLKKHLQELYMTTVRFILLNLKTTFKYLLEKQPKNPSNVLSHITLRKKSKYFITHHIFIQGK